MPLVSSEKMLNDAMKGGYAVGAFNIENMEMAMAVCDAAASLSAPVIIQTTPSTLKYSSPYTFAGIVKSLIRDSKTDVVLHLDHSCDPGQIYTAIDAGYTSVMYDGSHLSFEENSRITVGLTDYCSPRNIPVEAELGIIGGKEDDLVNGTVLYTDPSAAETFASVTGITSLAVAIGTAHGFYKTVPELDLGRLIEIRSKVRIPLVMHGASGLTDEQIKSAVVSGISKVNFATELRAAFTYAVREHLASHPDAYDPKTYLSAGRKAVFELVREKIGVLGWQM